MWASRCPDLKPVVAKLKANGYKMITTDSVAATVKVTDDIAAASPTTNIAFVLGPEDIKVELVEVKTRPRPSSCTTCTSSASNTTRCRRGTQRHSAPQSNRPIRTRRS